MRRIFSILILLALSLPAAGKDAAPQWNRVSGVHFSMMTDAPRKKADETLLRFEQMRAVAGELLRKSKLHLPEPLDIFGFANRAGYLQVAPSQVSATGLFLKGEDRNFVVLDMSDDQSWRTAAYPFARVLLYYNYPPTQPWFDEGFAHYFSSLRLDTHPPQIGGDPANLGARLTPQAWIPLPKLFAMDEKSAAKDRDIFSAESWIVMHYILTKDKLSETGNYFGLVEVKKLSIDQAIQQAFGVSAEQFDTDVKEYARATARALQSPVAAPGASGSPVQTFPGLIAAGDVGTSIVRVLDPEARALVDEVALRVPEHREAAVHELQTLSDGLNETAVGHRALAWAHLQKKEYAECAEELGRASDIDARDLWTRYYTALFKYKQAEGGKKDFQGLPNMMQDARAVTDLYPDFAEAHHLLAVAQLQGGGINAALDTIRIAIQLNPRSQLYVLDLAKTYLAGKKWDQATTLFDRLKSSPDPEIAADARRNLEDLPTLRKYGVLPQRAGTGASAAPAVVSSVPDDEPAAADAVPAKPAEPAPDHRKPIYLKGKIVSIDCSQAPAAILRVGAGARTLRLRTPDFDALVLIGAEKFSCDWKNIPVAVNYKAGGQADGDLVSVELQ